MGKMYDSLTNWISVPIKHFVHVNYRFLSMNVAPMLFHLSSVTRPTLV